MNEDSFQISKKKFIGHLYANMVFYSMSFIVNNIASIVNSCIKFQSDDEVSNKE